MTGLRDLWIVAKFSHMPPGKTAGGGAWIAIFALHVLGWQLYCRPGNRGEKQGWQCNYHPNMVDSATRRAIRAAKNAAYHPKECLGGHICKIPGRTATNLLTGITV
jgi:hypothetical protein